MDITYETVAALAFWHHLGVRFAVDLPLGRLLRPLSRFLRRNRCRLRRPPRTSRAGGAWLTKATIQAAFGRGGFASIRFSAARGTGRTYVIVRGFEDWERMMRTLLQDVGLDAGHELMGVAYAEMAVMVELSMAEAVRTFGPPEVDEDGLTGFKVAPLHTPILVGRHGKKVPIAMRLYRIDSDPKDVMKLEVLTAYEERGHLRDWYSEPRGRRDQLLALRRGMLDALAGVVTYHRLRPTHRPHTRAGHPITPDDFLNAGIAPAQAPPGGPRRSMAGTSPDAAATDAELIRGLARLRDSERRSEVTFTLKPRGEP